MTHHSSTTTFSTWKRLSVFLILFSLVLIYSSFLTADIFTGDSENLYSRVVKYISILLCLTLGLLIGDDGHDRRDRILLQCALCLHAAGDFFVGILGQFVIGVSIFFFMQLFYIARHSRGFTWNRTEIISALCFYVPIGIIFAYISPLLLKAGLFIPVLVYSLALVTSIWMGIGTIWRKFYPRTIDMIIAIAMVSFFFCDLNVGLYNSLSNEGHQLFVHSLGLPSDAARGVLPDSGSMAYVREITLLVPYTLRSIIGILVWFFYLPTVVLLALSGYRVSFLRSLFPLIPVLKEPDNIPSDIRD